LCSPEAVLRVYLARRRRIPKFQGFVSEGLIKLAGKFAKLYTSRKLKVPDSIVCIQREMRWRASSYQTLLRYEHDFTFEEFYQSARLVHGYESKHYTRNFIRERLAQDSSRYAAMFQLLDNSHTGMSQDEFEQLLYCFEIQTA
jgi:hypothetical protein